MKPRYYTVDLCVNEERGCFTGRLEAFDVWAHYADDTSEPMIELRPHIWDGDEEGGNWMGVPFEYESAPFQDAFGEWELKVVAITVAGHRFSLARRSVGSGGNWCWDSVSMRLSQIFRLLNHLKAARWTSPASGESLHLFDIEQGEEKWWAKWKDPTRQFVATGKAPRWFRALPRKRRRHFNRQSKRNLCLKFR